jgi:hypothetical protein
MNSPKYERTFHAIWSQGATNDDKIASDILPLVGKPIVITEKMDGSNTSLEKDGCFARTHSGVPTHPSFDGLKALHASVRHKIPEGIQLFGEWLYAVHSIHYTELPGYFLLFNVRDTKNNTWASWDEVELWADEIEVATVPLLFNGIVSSANELKNMTELLMKQPSCCGGIREGVVLRVFEEFSGDNFSSFVQKMVRKNHVQTSVHWREQEIVRNILRKI